MQPKPRPATGAFSLSQTGGYGLRRRNKEE